MKKYSLLALTGALLLGCSHKNEQSGVWIDMNGTYKEPMYLNYLKENYEKTDTLSIQKNGVYYIDFSTKPKGFYKLTTSGNNEFEFIFDKDTLLKINAIYSNFENSVIGGSSSTELLKQHNQLLAQYRADIDTLFIINKIAKIGELSDRKKDSLLSQISKITKAYRIITDKVIENNDANLANLRILSNRINDFPLYNITSDYEFIKQTVNSVVQKYPESESARHFNENLQSLHHTITKLNTLQKGKTCPKIEVMLADSTIFSTNTPSARRQIILIQNYNKQYDVAQSYLSIIYPLKIKEYDLVETFTDSITTPVVEKRWVKGIINKPKAYFDELPLPLIIVIDHDKKVLKQLSQLDELKDLLTTDKK